MMDYRQEKSSNQITKNRKCSKLAKVVLTSRVVCGISSECKGSLKMND